MAIKDLINVELNSDLIKGGIFKQIAEDKENIFFSNATKELMEKYPTDMSTTVNLWKQMLIDSICILKMNDSREKLYQDTLKIFKDDDSKKGDNKTTQFITSFESIRKMSSYGIDTLGKYFDDFVTYETVLYGTDKYYRDHVNHVLQVWAIGISLLYKYQNEFTIENGVTTNVDFHSQIDEDKINNINGEFFAFSKSEIWAMWTLIALCHDLGYPIEKTSKINEKARAIINHFGCINFEELNFSFGLFSNFIVSKFLDIISSKIVQTGQNKRENYKDYLKQCNYSTSIQSKYRDKLSKSLEEFKHGIFSSLLIFKNLTYFLETDYTYSNQLLNNEDSRQFIVRREILRAIAAHTCPKMYHVKLNTLSFLLILCDELQEWGRPNFDDFRSSGPPESIAVQLKKFDLTSSKQEVEIEFSYKENDENDLKTYIKNRFKHMHHLLRSAKDDTLRKVKFTWSVKFKQIVTYQFVFDSDQDSFNIIKFTKTQDKKIEVIDLYS